ncbi:hypothetical protein [Neotabrizicola shimadae]|uniref:Uncharacterized protein n=1 Tax=Neotabrizicola shimadae TaxID=2807096 RepID=A0A8G0ZN82_9RHOB|nr:hypothetical protein [Neotabrizicola shimadae]QYZ68461.1 hypothetical protein JO391_11760 [Neotabrizicola shimadae]
MAIATGKERNVSAMKAASIYYPDEDSECSDQAQCMMLGAKIVSHRQMDEICPETVLISAISRRDVVAEFTKSICHFSKDESPAGYRRDWRNNDTGDS